MDRLISEQAVIKILILLFIGNEKFKVAINSIKAIPSVEPKTGHWIEQDIHNCHTEFKCSACGYIHSFMHLYGKPTADYTFCPNCGAKMD